MKKHTLQHAIAQFKNAKGLSNRIAATATLINKTAYQTSKYLFDMQQQPMQKSTEPTERVVELIMNEEKTNDKQAIATISSTTNNTPTQQPALFDAHTINLIELNEQIKRLRFNLSEAYTEEEKNALHFKILRLERQRQEVALKRKAP